MDRRAFLAGSAAATALLSARPALAQDAYPSRAITIINPFPPGGATDVVTRPFAAALEPIIKQPVVIETKAGAAGAVGAQVAASAKPDGYTLLSHLPSLSGFAEVDRLFGRQPKFTNADFIPIARLIADPCVLIVNDAEGIHRRREKASGRNPVLVLRPLWRAAYSNGAVHACRESQAASSADTRRRTRADSTDRQQCAGLGLIRLGVSRANQGRQGEAARAIWQAKI